MLAPCLAVDARKQTRQHKVIQGWRKTSYSAVCVFSLVKCTNLDGLVGVSDESDEEAEHHVDEERDEGVEIESTEKPDYVAFVSHL